MSSWSRIVNRKKSVRVRSRSTLAKERLRRKYRPARVRLLFVGEAPPASGYFFYQADSGLYRAIREAFAIALPTIQESGFLESFRDLGCYLVDLCRDPVDRLSKAQRRRTWLESEARLGALIKRLRPRVVITMVRSVAPNVRRAQERANWAGPHVELPYPGRWRHHRAAFLKAFVPFLRQNLVSRDPNRNATGDGKSGTLLEAQ